MCDGSYRVFSKELKILVYEDDLSLLSEDYYDGIESNDIEQFFSFMKDDKFIVLENSRVKDLNNKFIYEGDIVKVTEDNNQSYIGVVEKYFGSLVISSTHKRTPVFIYLDDCNSDNCMASRLQVIGCKVAKNNDSIQDILLDINSGLNLINEYLNKNEDYIKQEIYELKIKLEEELNINFNEIETSDEYAIGVKEIYEDNLFYNCYMFDTYNLIVDFYSIMSKRINILTDIKITSPVNLDEGEFSTLSYDSLMERFNICINDIKAIYSKLEALK